MPKFALLTLSSMLLATSVFAVDGVVLINQATVIAAGGFPYRITQPGSYKLTGNLILATVNTTGIEILTDNVTIDLNGFSISGPLPCFACLPGSGHGILAARRNNITIRNGFITGVGGNGISVGLEVTGTAISDARGYIIEDVRVDVTGGWGIGVGVNSIVRRSSTTNNLLDGILIASGVVESNVSSDNGRNGILPIDGVNIVGNICLRNKFININLGPGGGLRAHNFCSTAGGPCPDGIVNP